MSKSYTKQELIKIINDVSEKINKRPRMRHVEEDVVIACEEIFGSWTNALKEAGAGRKYSKEDIIKKVNEKVSELNRTPLKRELDSRLYPYINEHFDGYNNMLKELNLELNNRFYTKEYLKEKILKWVEINNRVPTLKDLDEMEEMPHGTHVYYILDETWSEFLKSIGLEPNTSSKVKESKEELLQMYFEFSQKLGRAANETDLNDSDEIYNASIFRDRFGSMRNLKEAAGFVYFGRDPKYTKYDIVECLKDKYVKNNYIRLSRKRIEEDKELPCVNTIKRHFNTTSLNSVWDEIEKEFKKENIIKEKLLQLTKGINSKELEKMIDFLQQIKELISIIL